MNSTLNRAHAAQQPRRFSLRTPEYGSKSMSSDIRPESPSVVAAAQQTSPVEFTKLIRDGKVGVLYSPGFGAGWSTWNSDYRAQMCMDARLVQLVLDGKLHEAGKLAETFGEYICVLGSRDLTVEWLPVGTVFEISEYDGSESVRVHDNEEWLVA